MKCFIILLYCLLAVNFSAISQNRSKPAKAATGGENGVKQFWFVMLLKGSNRSQDSAAAASLQEAHMANIKRLYNEGKLKVAGPFGDDGDWRGIFIFDCPSREEVEQLLHTDAAIAAGRLAYEIHPWWTAPIGSFTGGKPATIK
jgi:uncharacterized protein